jgi:hypothetical protein
MSGGTETGQRRRRRVLLVPVRSVPVEFAGERAGEGPLTLAQLSNYKWLSLIPDDIYAILCAELPVPADVSVGDVAAAAAALIGRHEGLRTTYVPGQPPRQRVAAAGVQLLEVCSPGEGQGETQDRPAVGEALVRWLRESPDPGRLVRLAVAIAPDTGDRVIACAAAFSHIVVDHDAIEVLKRDFASLLGDPARRLAARPGRQPLDQAELEATPAERRRTDTALAHLGQQERRMPRCLYALPGARPSGESLVVALSSVAAAMAVRPVAARTRTSRSSVVLAAICAVVARRANYQELVLPLVSNNRFERPLVNYVGALAQNSAATVEIAGRSFDELVGHTWTRVAEASRHARYDPVKRDAMDERIEHERGLHLNRRQVFNNLVPESWSGLTAGVGFQPEEIEVALARTELRWRPAPANGNPIQFSLTQIDDCLRLDLWTADAGLVPRAELESVLLAVERLLVAAAHGDLTDGQLPEFIGLEPLAGTTDRILIDHSWVDVADVQRLVEDAIAPATARVFASAAGRNRHTPVAWLSSRTTPRPSPRTITSSAARHRPTRLTSPPGPRLEPRAPAAVS